MSDAIPRTPFALLSGSAGWGLRFPEDLHEPGVTVPRRGLRFDTPWGPTQNWQVIELGPPLLREGPPRIVLNVFAHGWPNEAIDHASHRRAAWVLQQAGVRKALADSTCGSLNKAIQPRDFVLPADVLDFTQTQHSLLPGRMRQVCYASQMLCPSLAGTAEQVARERWPAPGRVYGHGYGIVAAHNWGPRFTSAAEARAYQLLGGDVINQSIGPEASAMREIGACFCSTSYVVCYEPGVVGFRPNALEGIHTDLRAAATRISLHTLARAPLTEACGCAALRVERPADYLTRAVP